jgi:hypothetical protein
VPVSERSAQVLPVEEVAAPLVQDVAPRVAAESAPAGAEMISAEERAVLESTDCLMEVGAVVAPHREVQSAGLFRMATRLLELLTTATPQTRCLEVAARDARAHLAATIELEATSGLRSLARSLRDAVTDAGFCPSAPATPADLDALRAGPVRVESVRGTAWDCVQTFVFDDPVRYQYELRTAADGQSVEVVARGFPVAGQPAEELFVQLALGEESEIVVYRR